MLSAIVATGTDISHPHPDDGRLHDLGTCPPAIRVRLTEGGMFDPSGALNDMRQGNEAWETDT